MASSSTASSSRSTVPVPTSVGLRQPGQVQRGDHLLGHAVPGAAAGCGLRGAAPGARTASAPPASSRSSRVRASSGDGRALPLRRFEMWPGLHGTIRASSRTPTPRAVIRRASSPPKSLICVYRVEDKGRCPYGMACPNKQRLQATPRPGLDCLYPRTALREKMIMGRAAVASGAKRPVRGR